MSGLLYLSLFTGVAICFGCMFYKAIVLFEYIDLQMLTITHASLHM